MFIGFKIAVYESERGWGRKIDDWMVCLTSEDALLFKNEFNSENTEESVPDWYMVVIDEPVPIMLNSTQYSVLQKEKRVWLSSIER